MKSGKVLIVFLVILKTVNYGLSQELDTAYFFPIKPGVTNYLSGTMGEVRSNHFHAGMDIKTGGISGLPVYATKEGYISRIRISAAGYGNVLYVSHLNGETSVYGHLLRFRDDIAGYIRNEQYKKQSFEIDHFPAKEQFEIKKGELLGYSGNSGSSSGPHLHFEIRDKNQWAINPLTKNFREIRDDIPPVIQSFALRTLDINARINHQSGHAWFTPSHTENHFFYDTPIEAYGLIGLQIQAHDKISGSVNRTGLPYFKTYFDGEMVLETQIVQFSFAESRHTPVYYDYEQKLLTGKTFQKLYIDDGNSLPFYPFRRNDGKILITDTLIHHIEIILEDLYGNQSTLKFKLKGSIPKIMTDGYQSHADNQIKSFLNQNTLAIHVPYENNNPLPCLIHFSRMKHESKPVYMNKDIATYLWDMRSGLPDSVRIGERNAIYNYIAAIPSGNEFSYYHSHFDIKTTAGSLYDTLYLPFSYKQVLGGAEIFFIGDEFTPLASSVTVNLKPRYRYPETAQYAVYSTKDFNDFVFEGNKWHGNEIGFSTNTLGAFTILRDSIGPQITPLQIDKKRVSFRIRDDLSGIKSFNAYLNGEWLLMNYDEKRKYLWSESRNKNNLPTGELLLRITDKVGNESVFETKIQ